jgi:hypothetical protein
MHGDCLRIASKNRRSGKSRRAPASLSMISSDRKPASCEMGGNAGSSARSGSGFRIVATLART